jgi:hypothetical protein
MLDVSSRFLQALATTHQIVTHADVQVAGEVVLEDVAVQEATISVSAKAAVRRTCQVTLAITELPDELLPLGPELVLYRGVEFAADDQELVPLGVFRIDRTQIRRPNPFVQVNGSDRSILLGDDKLVEPFTPSGTVVQAIQALAEDSVPGIPMEITATSTATIPAETSIEAERWRGMTDLADSIEAEVFFDATGMLILRDKPKSEAPVVWRVGSENALVSTNTSMDRLKTFNGVIVEAGEWGEEPIVGKAYDDDPTSPTYWDGAFGHRPLLLRNETLTTQEEADAYAASELQMAKGLPRDVQLSNMVNPALDCGDVVQVDFVNGTSEAHRIDQLSFSLGASSRMNMRTTTLRVIDDE